MLPLVIVFVGPNIVQLLLPGFLHRKLRTPAGKSFAKWMVG